MNENKPTERDLIEEVEELLAKATPGRWYWTVNLKAKQISLQSQDGPRQYVMDFVRYGMSGAQPRFNVEGLMQDAQDCAVIVAGREHHAAWYQTLDHPDAALIEQAPELLRRLVAEVKDLRAANISKLLSEIKDRLTPEEGEQFQSLLMAATRGWVTEVTERSEVDRGLLEVFKDMPKRKRRRR